jgi:hypothetical protein
MQFIAFEAESRLTSLTAWAFSSLPSLQCICLPKTLEIMGESCLAYCRSLSIVYFEAGSRVRTIQQFTFRDSPSLRFVPVPPSLERFDGSIFAEQTSPLLMSHTDYPVLRMIGGFLIRNTPESSIVTSVSCAAVVTIPNTIKEISAYAFQRRTNLVKLEWEFDPVVTILGSHAFVSCPELRTILIPKTVTCIGEECFAKCESLAVVTFEADSQLRCIESGAFMESAISYLWFPSRLQRIGPCAFASCSDLRGVWWELPSALEVIEDGAFEGCKLLQSLELPSSIRRLAVSAVSGLSGSVFFRAKECEKEIQESACFEWP